MSADDLFPTRFETPAQSPGFQLWRVSNRWQREIRKTLLPLDLTHVQFVLLAVTTRLTADDRGDAALTQQRIADAAGIEKMMASTVIRSLEAKGLLRRERSGADQRAMRLTLTARGAELARQALVRVEDADAAFFGALGEEDARALGGLLFRLSDACREEAADSAATPASLP